MPCLKYCVKTKALDLESSCYELEGLLKKIKCIQVVNNIDLIRGYENNEYKSILSFDQKQVFLLISHNFWRQNAFQSTILK